MTLQRPTDEEGRPLSARRLLENEKLSRRLNRKVEELDRLIAASEGDSGDRAASGAPGFLCECSAQDCVARLPLGNGDYDRVHERPDCYTLVPGHEVPEVEVVVERADGWLVVRKTAPTSAPEVRG